MESNITGDVRDLISICIPVYEMSGYGVYFLDKLLQTCINQDYINKEIIVSDHSLPEYKDLFVLIQNKYPFVKYIKYNEKRGNGPANINNAMRYASGNWIKPMFQDDHFLQTDSLSRMYDWMLACGKRWIACAIKNYESIEESNINSWSYSPHWPAYKTNPIQIEEYNLQHPDIGSPSMVLFQKCNEEFDENLIHSMDWEMWYRLGNKLGIPATIHDHLVAVKIWEHSVTNKVSKTCLSYEKNYIVKKHHALFEMKQNADSNNKPSN